MVFVTLAAAMSAESGANWSAKWYGTKWSRTRQVEYPSFSVSRAWRTQASAVCMRSLMTPKRKCRDEPMAYLHSNVDITGTWQMHGSSRSGGVRPNEEPGKPRVEGEIASELGQRTDSLERTRRRPLALFNESEFDASIHTGYTCRSADLGGRLVVFGKFRRFGHRASRRPPHRTVLAVLMLACPRPANLARDKTKLAEEFQIGLSWGRGLPRYLRAGQTSDTEWVCVTAPCRKAVDVL